MSKRLSRLGALQARVPAGFKIYPSDVEHCEIPIVSGEEVADARADFDYGANEPVVAFRFNAAAKRRIAEFNIPLPLSR